MLASWWAWITAALVLGIVEALVPVYIFLGFSLGAAATGVVLLMGGGFADWLLVPPARLFVFFAIVSVLAWIGLRSVLGVRKGQVKIWDRNINEE